MRALQEVRIGKKDYPILFGNAAFADYCDVRNVSEKDMWVQLFGEEMKPGDLITLIWCALFHGARRHSGVPGGDPDFKLTQYDLADMLDDDTEAMKKVFEILRKSLPVPEKEESGNVTAPA